MGYKFAWPRPLTPALSPKGRGGVYGAVDGWGLDAGPRRRLRKGNPGTSATARRAKSLSLMAQNQKIQGWPGDEKATLGMPAMTCTADSLAPLAGRGLG